MDISKNKLAELLRSPEKMDQFNLSDWDVIIRQARASNLMFKLYHLFEQKNDLGKVPLEARRHLEASRHLGANLHHSVFLEVEYINSALKCIGLPVVLLKGAAYVIKGAEAGNGRLFSDIDILVEKNHLPEAEKIFKQHGWFASNYDEYNDRYYRSWMHEIPPLTHVKRDSVLDVHHAIIPPTANLKPDTSKLFNCIEQVDGLENVFTLSSIDMVLHSAVHLFQDGELEHGFRDLVDLDALAREFSAQDSSFWEKLVSRAQELGLQRPLYYAIRYTRRFLNTPISQLGLHGSEEGKPSFPKLMDFLFERALMPAHSTCDDSFTALARWVLYIRAHYLRMPLSLLLPHLIRKAYMKRVEKNKAATAQ